VRPLRSPSCDVLIRAPGQTPEPPRKRENLRIAGALSRAAGQDCQPGVWVMCDAPRDLERKAEQRWAAKFAQSVRTMTPEKPQPESSPRSPRRPAKAKGKSRRTEPATSPPRAFP